MQIRSSELVIPPDDPFKNDELKRKELEPPLTQFVTQAVGPFVLAVDGSWGSGKTTFLKMWQVKLDDAGHLCLYLNAWKTDFVQDPLVAVVGELSIAIKKHPLDRLDKNNVNETIGKIEEKAKLIAKRLIPLGVRFLTHGIVNIEPAMEKILADLAGETAQDLIEDYDKGKSDIEAFRESLSSLATAIQEPNQDPVKIVITIDELDRCRPTYAVQLLERIKHLFDVEGVVFILGIDRTQLSHSIKALYGSEFDATVYLKRFIDIDYNLPEPSIGSYCPFLFKRFGIDSLLSQRPGDNNHNLSDLSSYLGYLMSSAQMSLRTQEQVVSRLRVVLQTIPKNEFLFPITLSILLFLRELDREIYMSVMKGNLTCKGFIALIEGLPIEAQAFQTFSELAKYSNYGYFSKERIQGVFLAGLSQILSAVCPEEKEYRDMLNSNENLSDSVRWIVESISEERGGLNKTVQRLNLTSSFVQN
jgi:KAP family P-loop domain